MCTSLLCQVTPVLAAALGSGTSPRPCPTSPPSTPLAAPCSTAASLLPSQPPCSTGRPLTLACPVCQQSFHSSSSCAAAPGHHGLLASSLPPAHLLHAVLPVSSMQVLACGIRVLLSGCDGVLMVAAGAFPAAWANSSLQTLSIGGTAVKVGMQPVHLRESQTRWSACTTAACCALRWLRAQGSLPAAWFQGFPDLQVLNLSYSTGLSGAPRHQIGAVYAEMVAPVPVPASSHELRSCLAVLASPCLHAADGLRSWRCVMPFRQV